MKKPSKKDKQRLDYLFNNLPPIQHFNCRCTVTNSPSIQTISNQMEANIKAALAIINPLHT